MKDFYSIQLTALNHFDLPVARFDRDGVLTYLNAAAEKLLATRADRHVDFGMLFPDQAQYDKVRAEMDLRLKGESSAYITSFHRPFGVPGEDPIPVSVYAFPESDCEGQVTGSLALIRDLREERASAAIHRAIETCTENDALLAALAEQVRKLIPFDEFRITTVSKGRMHLRTLYSSDANAPDKYPYRWWPMPPFIQQTLRDYTAGVLNMDELFSRPGYTQMLEDDPNVRRYRASGVREVQNLPITHGNDIVAFVALDAMREGRFNDDTVALLGRLPVAEVVTTAIHREERHHQRFVFDLIRHLGTLAVNAHRVAEEMVACLVRGFGWEHVSIFQVEDAPASIRLVCQANRADQALPAGFETPCDAPDSALAWVARTGQRLNVPDSRQRGPFAATPGFIPKGSQLVVPIPGHATWALNVESKLANAFSTEEIELLELLAHEAASVLHRSALFELQSAVLGAINDAVIETARDGQVRWYNAAAAHMFKLAPHAQHLHMADLLQDRSNWKALAETPAFSRREVDLRASNGHVLPVLLSSSTLPEHLGGRVYVASDFTFQHELRRQGALKEVFRHAAMEGRVPLSLAATWLEQSATEHPELRPAIDKVLSQLGRADLPLERLLRLFSGTVERDQARYADLGRAVQLTLDGLPASMLAAIDADRTPETLPVTADFNDLQFCAESMLAFGLRTRPQSKTLQVSTSVVGASAVLRVTGDWKPETGIGDDPGGKERWRRKALYDLTLGERVLCNVAQRAGGKFHADLGKGFKLVMELPLRL